MFRQPNEKEFLMENHFCNCGQFSWIIITFYTVKTCFNNHIYDTGKVRWCFFLLLLIVRLRNSWVIFFNNFSYSNFASSESISIGSILLFKISARYL